MYSIMYLHLYLYSSVVGVQHQLCQRNHLSCAVPSVAAVHQNGFAPVVDRLHDVTGDGHQLAEIVEPLGALQVGEEAGEEGKEW